MYSLSVRGSRLGYATPTAARSPQTLGRGSGCGRAMAAFGGKGRAGAYSGYHPQRGGKFFHETKKQGELPEPSEKRASKLPTHDECGGLFAITADRCSGCSRVFFEVLVSQSSHLEAVCLLSIVR